MTEPMKPAVNARQSQILLVDDEASHLHVLREALEGTGCRIFIAKSGSAALEIIAKSRPDLILLDVVMPGMDGYEVCRRLKANDATQRIPVIFLTAMTDSEDEARGLALGAVDYINKPINPDLVRARVRNHLELKRHQDSLEDLVQAKTLELELTQAVMIESLAALAEFRDPETGGHIKRTQNYVKVLAMRLQNHPRFRDALDAKTIGLLYHSAPLHDVGKVAVPDHILFKTGRLDDGEFAEMKKHAIWGEEALRRTEQKLGKSTFMRLAREIAGAHHEKWDGSGYPRGLKGEEIPVSARLMALADVYDALTSRRVYKPPMSHSEAVSIMRQGHGTHFDPDVVDAFLACASTFHNIALTFADSDEERRTLGGGKITEKIADLKSGLHVLLVEDDPISREIMGSQLTALGLEVTEACDGNDALEQWRRGEFDIVLTDVDMPGLDGYGLATAIRRIEPATGRRFPILAITASDFDLDEKKAHCAGLDGYMLKPLSPENLARKLRILLPDMPGPRIPEK